MRHFSALPLLGLLLALVSLSWAQTNLTSSSSSGSISLSSMSSLNTSSTSSSATLTSSAQFPALSGYSSCVTNCLAVGVASVNCSSIIDINCYCVNATFPQQVFTCIQADCPSELMTEEKLAQQFCNLASSSPSLSFPNVTSSSASSSSPSSSGVSSLPQSTPSPTSTPSSGTTLNPGTALLCSGFLTILVYPLSIYLM